MINKEEIRELTIREIKEQIQETQNFLVRMKINHAVSPLENPMQLKNARREVAQLKTELKRRQLEGELNENMEQENSETNTPTA